MSKCITAFTEVDYPEEAYYPGYVSINAEDDKVEIAIRETGSEDTHLVHVPLEHFEIMLDELNKYMGDLS